jgi:hypothetical protein
MSKKFVATYKGAIVVNNRMLQKSNGIAAEAIQFEFPWRSFASVKQARFVITNHFREVLKKDYPNVQGYIKLIDSNFKFEERRSKQDENKD